MVSYTGVLPKISLGRFLDCTTDETVMCMGCSQLASLIVVIMLLPFGLA